MVKFVKPPPRETHKKLKLGYRIKNNMGSYAMIAPFFIFFIVFTVIPVLAAIVVSFTDFNLFSFPNFVGASNYMRMADDRLLFIALRNTMVFVFINGPIGFVFAFLMAWLINEMPRKLRVLMTVLFYAPSVSGNVFFIWQFLFSGDMYGMANGFLMRIGYIQEPVQWLTSTETNLTIAVIVSLWMSLGIGFLAFIAGFQSIDESQYEAGTMDGVANRGQELWYITIPNMKNMLLFAAVLQIAGAFSVGAVTQALTGGFGSANYSTLTILNLIDDYAQVRLEMGYASALGVLLFAMIVVSKKLIFKLLKL
ncbi:MAG: sugar ABC transporter permease [Oscillospiraceae bacterium]|nr:sugar ABC transporter permease [Oscillospiraceae bacterium]